MAAILHFFINFANTTIWEEEKREKFNAVCDIHRREERELDGDLLNDVIKNNAIK